MLSLKKIILIFLKISLMLSFKKKFMLIFFKFLLCSVFPVRRGSLRTASMIGPINWPHTPMIGTVASDDVMGGPARAWSPPSTGVLTLAVPALGGKWSCGCRALNALRNSGGLSFLSFLREWGFIFFFFPVGIRFLLPFFPLEFAIFLLSFRLNKMVALTEK